jgi:hypothetical protein
MTNDIKGAFATIDLGMRGAVYARVAMESSPDVLPWDLRNRAQWREVVG